MFKNKELIKDINELRNNVNIKKYDNLQSNLKDFGNLLKEYVTRYKFITRLALN